ncbi:MAG: hypothetical protein PWQ22_837 [Archaeoglobaceae archaeon]|nr:hypothetical protein [Archaeoglobaceae archaeon]
MDKPLTIRSENGPANCIVYAADLYDHVFEVTADYVNISGFTISGADGDDYAGIYLLNADYSIIHNNNISHNDYGIYLDKSSYNTLSSNTVQYNFDDGILHYYSSNNTLIGNIVQNNDKDGIYLWHSNNNTLSGNIVQYNKLLGIYLGSSNNNKLIGNTFTNDGLFVWHSYNNRVENNTVNGKPLVYLEDAKDYRITFAGQVILVNCKNITVENLSLSDTDVGIELWETTDSRIVNNIVQNNDKDGIWLGSSNNNTLIGNTVQNNGYDGIDLYYSNNNTLIGNIVQNNDWYGIRLQHSDYNKIYLNFINNSYNVFSYSSTNIWNSTEPITYTYKSKTYTNYLGNYWSGYTSADSNGDGILDKPYVISKDNVDNYPLAEPFQNYGITPTLVEVTLSPSVVPVNRPFDILVKLRNTYNEAKEFKVEIPRSVVLGGAFSVEPIGEDVKIVELQPNEEVELRFKAKVEMIVNSTLPAFNLSGLDLVKVYADDELIYEYDNPDLVVEFATISWIFSPPYVKVGESFRISAHIAYNFIYDTKLKIELRDNNTVIGSREITVKGQNSEIVTLYVPGNNVGSKGLKEFRVSIKAYAPELGEQLPIKFMYAKTYEIFSINVGDIGSNEPRSGLVIGPEIFKISYMGENYTAIRAEDISLPFAAVTDPEKYFEKYNWIILDSEGNLVRDDELYKNLSLIAEVIRQRLVQWCSDCIENKASIHSELASEMYWITTLKAFQTTLAMFGHKIFLTVIADGLAPKIIMIEEGIGKTVDKLKIGKILMEMNIAEAIEYALDKIGGDATIFWGYVTTGLLNNSARELRDANKMFMPSEVLVKYVEEKKAIDGESILNFYNTLLPAIKKGEAAWSFFTYLSIKMSDFKEWLVDPFIKLIGGEFVDVIEFAADVFINSYQESKENPVTMLLTPYFYYEIWENSLKNNSLKFRDKFFEEFSGATVLKLNEKPGQHKLHFIVMDSSGRIAGYDRMNESIVVEIPGTHYIDLGDKILVIAPPDAEIERVIVDAADAVEEVESYELSVSSYVEGNPVSENVVEDDISQGLRQAYQVVEAGNNVLELHPIQEPDLTVTQITVSPDPPIAGKTATVTATIKNIGNANAGSSNACLYVNNNLIGKTPVKSLAAGGSDQATFSWKPVTAGTYTLRVVADVYDEVAESNEANNEKSIDDLLVEEPSITPPPLPSIIDWYDENKNGRIDDNELINGIMDWLNGSISDLELIEMIMSWLS